MEGFVLFVVVIVLLIRWRILAKRLADMEQRIAATSRVGPEEISRLVRRIYLLEEAVAQMGQARAAAPVAEAGPVSELISEPALPPEPIAASPEPVAVEEPGVVLPEFIAPSAPPPRPRSSEEWEAIVGANWLNKLGIAVLVIAVALFLGYSFTQMGPGGRSAIGLAVSLGLLAGGAVVEKRERYAIFGRGMLGGGWAGLYFTTYAMQAVEAAKVIDNPVLGAVLLMAVAAGMVLHALRYRVQAVTGTAYTVAFITLAITPITTLSVIALIPLAASLLVIAYRFSWPAMVLLSLLATYATCASRGDSGAPLWSTQLVFTIYWLLFEIYDLLRIRRHSNHGAEQALLSLNAVAFTLLSYAKWSAAAPDRMYQLATGLAVAYLAGTTARALLRPPSSFAPETSTADRLLAGGYEGPVTLAALFSALAVGLKLHGQTVNVVLLAEGELLFLAGLYFRQQYLRYLAAGLFVTLGIKFMIKDAVEAGRVQFANLDLHDWTPPAALAGLLFYANRMVPRAGVAYGYAASFLFAMLIGVETSMHFRGSWWLAAAALVLGFGWYRRLFDFRLQGYVIWMFALVAIAWHQLVISSVDAVLPHVWMELASATLLGAAGTWGALRAGDRLRTLERKALLWTASAAAVALAAALLWRIVPDNYLAPAWAFEALLLVALGRRVDLYFLRPEAHAVAAIALARALYMNFQGSGTLAERVAAGALVVGCLFAAQLLSSRERSPGARLYYSLAATVLATLILFQEVSGSMLTVAWGIEGVALLAAGFPLRDRTLRLSGLGLFLICIGKLFFYDLRQLETLYRIMSFFVLGVILVGVSWVYTRFRDQIQRYL